MKIVRGQPTMFEILYHSSPVLGGGAVHYIIQMCRATTEYFVFQLTPVIYLQST